MNQNRRRPKSSPGWASWSIRLNQLGLGGLAASFAEAGKPLAPALAQLLHIANPLLDSSRSQEQMRALAETLENTGGKHE